MNLEDRWGALAESMEMPHNSWWYLIKDAYTEPHRHYHTLTHIEDGLDVLDKLGADLATKVAFWFHDLRYDPLAKDNEELSAASAVHFLLDPMPICYGMDMRDEISRLILLTKDHKVDWWDKNGCHMVVADLHGLGSDRETYELNAQNVRKEYGEFSDDEWVTGRLKFLEAYGSRELFPPMPEYKVLNQNAYLNMRHEHEDLLQGRYGRINGG